MLNASCFRFEILYFCIWEDLEDQRFVSGTWAGTVDMEYEAGVWNAFRFTLTILLANELPNGQFFMRKEAIAILPSRLHWSACLLGSSGKCSHCWSRWVALDIKTSSIEPQLSHYCGASIPMQLLSSSGGPIRILMNGEHLESFSKSGREPGIIFAVLLPAIDFV